MFMAGGSMHHAGTYGNELLPSEAELMLSDCIQLLLAQLSSRHAA